MSIMNFEWKVEWSQCWAAPCSHPLRWSTTLASASACTTSLNWRIPIYSQGTEPHTPKVWGWWQSCSHLWPFFLAEALKGKKKNVCFWGVTNKSVSPHSRTPLPWHPHRHTVTYRSQWHKGNEPTYFHRDGSFWRNLLSPGFSQAHLLLLRIDSWRTEWYRPRK